MDKKYSIVDAEGRLWARATTYKQAKAIVEQLAKRITNQTLTIKIGGN
jgi:hypothetical protein